MSLQLPTLSRWVSKLGAWLRDWASHQSFFSLAAWYAVLAPVGTLSLIWNCSMTSPPGRHSEPWYLDAGACVLLSSVLASIVSLFGIRSHNWLSIIWKSVFGIILSWIGLMSIGMATAVPQ